MRGDPARIIRVGTRRYTRDRRFRVGARFGLCWVAFRCRCGPDAISCPCPVQRLPGGIAGEGFMALKSLQAALRSIYTRRGWYGKDAHA